MNRKSLSKETWQIEHGDFAENNKYEEAFDGFFNKERKKTQALNILLIIIAVVLSSLTLTAMTSIK